MTAVDPSGRPELLAASDQTIADALDHADPMVLRGLLYQLTGDEEIAATEVGRTAAGIVTATDADAALIRRKACAFLTGYRDGGAGAISAGAPERLPTSLTLTAGEDIAPEAIEFWLEQLALNPWARGLERQLTVPTGRSGGFSVIIIGSGMGGLNAAIQLKHAGIPFTVIEKNPGVGGTWYENRYPGARVDTPSRVYTHTFGVSYSYPSQYSLWTENQKYLNWITDSFGVRDHIVFNTEVQSLVWDEPSSTWTVSVDGPDGPATLRSNAVISAVGVLNRPNVPEFAGQEVFEGDSWHTASWPAHVDLSSKRVAVIGTGCTGYQLIPELALQAGHVVVFQRTPQWLFAAPGYCSSYPPPSDLARSQSAVPHELPALSDRADVRRPVRGRRRHRSRIRRPAGDQPGQQAGPRQLHRTPRAEAGRFRAGREDDTAPPGHVGPAGTHRS